MRRLPASAFACVLGCSGVIGDADPGGPADPTMDPGAPGMGDAPEGPVHELRCEGEMQPSVASLGRFTAAEYERNLQALFGDPALRSIRATLSTLPADELSMEGAFGRQDQRLSERHVTTFFRVADQLAATAAADAELRVRLGGTCESIDPSCYRDFATTLLRHALRRPATSDEVSEAVAAAEDFEGPEAVHAMVFLALMAPDFLYRFETRGEVAGAEITLTPYELASRLSYHFWGAPPDQELLAAADSGALSSREGYAEQVERMFGDPRTDATLHEFFEEWLHLERGQLVSSPRLDVLRGDIELEGLADAMREEVMGLIDHHLADPAGTWSDVLVSPLSFARDERLAAIYGVDVWDGESAPPELPADERSGLLTRAGMLISTDGSTNPFRRGVFVRRALLCDHVAPPPATLPADALSPPPLEGGATTREVFAEKVRNEPCASCHAQFSPFGYALEAYDGLGRFREEEHLVTDQGENLGFAAVNTEVVPRVEAGDESTVSSAVELSARIAESEKANECLARHYFRFTYRHFEGEADACTVDSWTRALEEGLSLREALRAVALDPVFRQRRLEE